MIDGASNTTTTVAAGTNPDAIALNPVTNKIYVANVNGNDVTVVATPRVDPPTNPPRLANISTRMEVLNGNNVMIAGFIIGGSTPKTLAIVATGPSLAAFGITNPLANPTLQLVRQSDQW